MQQAWHRFSSYVTAKPKRPRVAAIAFVLATEVTLTGAVAMGIRVLTR